ncbi:MAG: GtrA family protein [Muribaculaceae bacterium]|nr:GtrA family protein [Muribaculaceae bacterium]
MDKLKNVGDKLLHNNSLVFTFLRSIVSSQAASWTDMIVRVLLFSFVFKALDPFYRSNLSVACGAILGGVVNCAINYHFTFHASGQSVRAVIVKYILVWTGSLLLNMYGTTFGAMGLSRWEFLHKLGFTPDAIFAVSTLLVSLLVSWFWNFALQRYFVYRPTRFDPLAIRVASIFVPRKRGNSSASSPKN